MSKHLPPRPAKNAAPSTFGVVASAYHVRFMDGLISNFVQEIEAIAPGSTVHVHRAPGSFEIPILAQAVAEQGECSAIVAFGVIMEGATGHASLIATTVTEALMRISLQHRIPVLNEILLVKDEQQAEERCLGLTLNRGIEAARAAVSIIESLAPLRVGN